MAPSWHLQVAFKQIWLPKSVMLDKYVCIENDQYVQKVKGIRNMEMIGQRLYTGRVAVAQAIQHLSSPLRDAQPSPLRSLCGLGGAHLWQIPFPEH